MGFGGGGGLPQPGQPAIGFDLGCRVGVLAQPSFHLVAVPLLQLLVGVGGQLFRGWFQVVVPLLRHRLARSLR